MLQIKKRKGPERLSRIRFGAYRLLYTVESFELVAIVMKIGPRREISRSGLLGYCSHEVLVADLVVDNLSSSVLAAWLQQFKIVLNLIV